MRVVQYTQSESIRLCDLTNRLDKSQCENESGFEMTWFQFKATLHTGSRFARHLEKNCNLVKREGRKRCRFDSIRSIRDNSSALMSTRHTGSRFSRHLEKNATWLIGQSRKFCRFDSIRSIRDDSSALMSTRHTGSRFARHLEKNCKLVNRAVSKMFSIRLDSIDSRRFVCLDVDPSYRKSICATLREKLRLG